MFGNAWVRMQVAVCVGGCEEAAGCKTGDPEHFFNFIVIDMLFALSLHEFF